MDIVTWPGTFHNLTKARYEGGDRFHRLRDFRPAPHSDSVALPGPPQDASPKLGDRFAKRGPTGRKNSEGRGFCYGLVCL